MEIKYIRKIIISQKTLNKMVQQIVYTDKREDKKIIKLSKEWQISKAETIKKIIREFEWNTN